MLDCKSVETFPISLNTKTRIGATALNFAMINSVEIPLDLAVFFLLPVTVKINKNK